MVLTGGRGRTHLDSLNRVSLYNRGGWLTDMPSLKNGRYAHGCTSFTTEGEQVRLGICMMFAYHVTDISLQILLVTGGWGDDWNQLDSTEVLRPASLISGWNEINSGRLPKSLAYLRLANVDNRVLLFGEWR